VLRRLYRQFYLTIVVSLLAVVLFAGALWRFAPDPSPAEQAFEMAEELAAALVPPAEQGVAAQQAAIDRLHARLGVDLALYDADRRHIASAGRPVPTPRWRASSGWVRGAGGPAWAIHLPDGRWIVARAPGRRPPVLRLIVFLGSAALVIALCAYPLARRLTRRLERLQAGVESLGAGDLGARVKVEGKDEVARLAQSFNRSAERIEQLVASHKLMLANASHELRTPLARIRLGAELLKDGADTKRKAELERDIAELDQLIDEILLSSRLDAVKGLDMREEIDLLALAAEEGARFEQCAVAGAPVQVQGDRALLRRLVRNLIENAERHGRPPIEVEVRLQGNEAVVTVSDAGPGVADGDRERIFSPFFRTASAGSGTGLGLTLVRQIARQHGGDAAWIGTPARPSAIAVTLPVAPRPTPA
jgi:signal transduction histidine kinase